MIAKIIVHDSDRDKAIARLDAALRDTRIGGLANNTEFVRTCLNHTEFQKGNVYTDFIPDHETDLLPAKKTRSERSIIEGVCARLLLAPRRNPPLGGPFGETSYFRVNHAAEFQLKLDDDTSVSTNVTSPSKAGDSIHVRINDENVRISDVVHSTTSNTRLAQCEFTLETADGTRQQVHAVQLNDSLAVCFI